MCVCVTLIPNFLESNKADAQEVWSVLGMERRDGRWKKYQVWEENKQYESYGKCANFVFTEKWSVYRKMKGKKLKTILKVKVKQLLIKRISKG